MIQRIVNNFKWAMKRTSHLFFFWLEGSEHSQYLRIQQMVNMLAFPMLAGGKREKKREGENLLFERAVFLRISLPPLQECS
jgi:hypothetical protein